MRSSPFRGYKPALDLTGSDFEALRGGPAAGRKARQRSRLRERMSAWGRRVSPRLSTLGIESELVLSEEDHAETLRFVTRGDEGVLGLRVEERGVEVGLDLPPVKLDSEVASSRLLASLESLPEQFVVRAHGEEIAAQGASLEVIERQASWIGWQIPRAVVIEHADLLDEQLEDALAALAGVLAVSAPGGPKMSSPKKAPRLPTSTTRRARPAQMLGSGAHVQVLCGPFAGKVGIIVDLDGKGGARVALGLLEARMAVRDLALAEGGRPKLATSHRRVLVR